MAGIEIYLKQEFPEATEAECRRFVSTCRQQYYDVGAKNNNTNKKDNSVVTKQK